MATAASVAILASDAVSYLRRSGMLRFRVLISFPWAHVSVWRRSGGRQAGATSRGGSERAASRSVSSWRELGPVCGREDAWYFRVRRPCCRRLPTKCHACCVGHGSGGFEVQLSNSETGFRNSGRRAEKKKKIPAGTRDGYPSGDCPVSCRTRRRAWRRPSLGGTRRRCRLYSSAARRPPGRWEARGEGPSV